MQTIYRATCWGQVWQLRADWAQAAETIYALDDDGQWMPAGIGHVGDYRHQARAAMRRYLEQVAQDGGDCDPAAIRAALARADAARQLGRTQSPRKASSSRQNGRRGGCKPGQGGRPAVRPFVVLGRRYGPVAGSQGTAGAVWACEDVLTGQVYAVRPFSSSARRREIVATLDAAKLGKFPMWPAD